ncbi:hypothetical protein D3C80_2110420 [compost metagenome]
MHTDAQACGQFGVVVDDQLGLVALAQVAQCFGFPQAAGLVAAFVAVLQQGDATFQRRFDISEELAGQQLAIGDGVKAT